MIICLYFYELWQSQFLYIEIPITLVVFLQKWSNIHKCFLFSLSPPLKKNNDNIPHQHMATSPSLIMWFHVLCPLLISSCYQIWKTFLVTPHWWIYYTTLKCFISWYQRWTGFQDVPVIYWAKFLKWNIKMISLELAEGWKAI